MAQWIRRRSPKPKIASSSLAVGKVFTHPAVKKVPNKMTSVSAVGFFFFIFIYRIYQNKIFTEHTKTKYLQNLQNQKSTSLQKQNKMKIRTWKLKI